MRPLSLVLALSALALFSASPSPAAAQGQTLELGRPPAPVTLRVEARDGSVWLRAARGARRAEAELSLTEVGEVGLEAIVVTGGESVGVVRASGGGAEAVALVRVAARGPEILWVGRTDLHGDLGERSRDVVTLEDRTGDGHPDIVVGVAREATSLCHEEQTLLAPRAYDPSRGALRPVVLRRLSPELEGQAARLEASRTSPGPEGPPLVRALRFVGASSTAGIPEGAALIEPPRALVDQDGSTFWAEGRGGPGRGEFVVARWETDLVIRALAFTLAPTGEGATRLGRPRVFWVVTDRAPPMRVAVAEDPAGAPGERFWVTPPSPLEARCVSILLDEAYLPEGANPDTISTGLAEVEVYTSPDFGEGVDDLVARVVSGTGGDEASRLLGSLGEVGIRALDESWERLDPLGRRRAIRALFVAGRGNPAPAVRTLARALAVDEDPEVRAASLEALGGITHESAAAALTRALATEIGDDAVEPLLNHPSAAVPALLGAISAEGGSERAALRLGLARALGTGEEGHAAFAAWLENDPAVAALASVAFGLSREEVTRPLVREHLAAALARAETFEDRYRLTRAAAAIEVEDAALDAHLDALAAGAEEWMLRAAAVVALHRRGSPLAPAAAARALSDEYPRVRVAGIEASGAGGAADEAIASRVRDGWALVRASAVEALGERSGHESVIRSAIGDPTAWVRASAIRAATRRDDEAAWPAVRARLEDSDEWPRVHVAALGYVETLCVEDAAQVLSHVIARAFRPSPFAPDIDVAALAVGVGVSLGGEAEVIARRAAGREDAPASLRNALERTPEHPSCLRAREPRER